MFSHESMFGQGQSFFMFVTCVQNMGKKCCKTNSNSRRPNKSIICFGIDNVFKSLSIGSWSYFVGAITNRHHGNQIPNAYQFIEYFKNHWTYNVTTLALGSRPRKGFARLRAQRTPGSEGKCEGMNPHIPKGVSTLGIWSSSGLPNLQRTISRVKTQWIENFFI